MRDNIPACMLQEFSNCYTGNTLQVGRLDGQRGILGNDEGELMDFSTARGYLVSLPQSRK